MQRPAFLSLLAVQNQIQGLIFIVSVALPATLHIEESELLPVAGVLLILGTASIFCS
jgi:hypothetical protein